MTAFSIRFHGASYLDPAPRERVRAGRLAFGGLDQTFVAPLQFWTVSDYRISWRTALRRALEREASALITEMRDPAKKNQMVWWPLYVDGRDLVIQQQTLALDGLAAPFSPEEPWAHVPGRATRSGGERVVEWRTSIADIRAFVEA